MSSQNRLYPEMVSPKMAPQFLASKWIHFDFLVETAELAKLFLTLGEPLFLFSTMGVQEKGKSRILPDEFLAAWERYIECLRQGNKVDDPDFRYFFTAIMSYELNAMRSVEIPGEREVIIPYEPIMQMQMHRFTYSLDCKKIHSQAFGEGSISWGIRLSYPQLFQYPQTRQVEAAQNVAKFKNALLVSKVRSWLREVSVPTPLEISGQRQNVPIRLGKSCFPWINNHFDLVRKDLRVHMLQF
jgi:hypothetical protein